LFLGEVITGKKRVLKKKDVPRLSAPHWQELSLKEIWPKVSQDKELLLYFPRESKLDMRPPDRTFFWGVMQTIRADFCEVLIGEAKAKRNQAISTVPKSNTILNIGITNEWANLLLEKPFVSSKCAHIHLAK